MKAFMAISTTITIIIVIMDIVIKRIIGHIHNNYDSIFIMELFLTAKSAVRDHSLGESHHSQNLWSPSPQHHRPNLKTLPDTNTIQT